MDGQPAQQAIEGAELRSFLMSLDEYQQIFRLLERRTARSRAWWKSCRGLDLHIDTKADFAETSQPEAGVRSAEGGEDRRCEMKHEEEHSSWRVMYRDPTNAERSIDVELAAQPEYRRLRAFAKQHLDSYNQPPFVVVKENHRETLDNWRDLLAHVKGEGTREVQVQRYKGLGEMNAEQLWETTMNAETRTLLQVSVEDLVQCDEIFTTLMGEDVENRRKFIEDNALDVRNLDV